MMRQAPPPLQNVSSTKLERFSQNLQSVMKPPPLSYFGWQGRRLYDDRDYSAYVLTGPPSSVASFEPGSQRVLLQLEDGDSHLVMRCCPCPAVFEHDGHFALFGGKFEMDVARVVWNELRAVVTLRAHHHLDLMQFLHFTVDETGAVFASDVSLLRGCDSQERLTFQLRYRTVGECLLQSQQTASKLAKLSGAIQHLHFHGLCHRRLFDPSSFIMSLKPTSSGAYCEPQLRLLLELCVPPMLSCID